MKNLFKPELKNPIPIEWYLKNPLGIFYQKLRKATWSTNIPSLSSKVGTTVALWFLKEWDNLRQLGRLWKGAIWLIGDNSILKIASFFRNSQVCIFLIFLNIFFRLKENGTTQDFNVILEKLLCDHIGPDRSQKTTHFIRTNHQKVKRRRPNWQQSTLMAKFISNMLIFLKMAYKLLVSFLFQIFRRYRPTIFILNRRNSFSEHPKLHLNVCLIWSACSQTFLPVRAK